MLPHESIKESLGKALNGKRIVLGITGSIAAVECVKLARMFVRYGAEVIPVMTDAATRIIHPDAMEFATGIKPILEFTGRAEHVELFGYEDRVDAFVIAPATANTIAKIVHGIADNPITTMAISSLGNSVPIIVAPAMHGSMLNSPMMQKNIEQLIELGVLFVWPVETEKKAKMADIETIVYRTMQRVNNCGKKTLVITGATVEPIDNMRIITNISTGKMGIEIARAFYRYGFDTEIWYGNVTVPVPEYLKKRKFFNVDSLLKLVESNIFDFDVIVNAAAISDYTLDKMDGKIKSGKEKLILELRPTPKIIQIIIEKLKDLGIRDKVVVVGFKAESGIEIKELLNSGKQARKDMGVNFVVANLLEDVTVTDTRVHLINEDNEVTEYKGEKVKVAEELVKVILQHVFRITK